MGQIYAARHLQTGKKAAIKVLERDDPEAQTRFRLEARVAAALNHPGIVDVYDADVDEATGRFYLAMELLEGRTLRAVMDDPHETPTSLLRLLLLVLEPLVAAHEMGYVHRDLKPENIFVVGSSSQPTVKLLDFGIAGHELRKGLTLTGTAMGTPHYMSPEQAMDAAHTSPATDVWSMGVLLYEAISGQVPFEGESPHAVVVRACTEDPTPLGSVVSDVSPEVSALVMRCLTKNPAGRPPDAAALRAELLRHVYPASVPASRIPSRRMAVEAAPSPPLGSVPIQAHPPTQPPAAPNRTASQFPLAVSVAGTGLVALALLGRGWAVIGTPELVFFGAIGAVVAIVGALIFPKKKPPQAPQQAAVIAANDGQREETHTLPPPQRGPGDARVTIELFGDPCNLTTRRVAHRLIELQARHHQDVKLTVQAFPQGDDRLGWLVAEAAEELLRRLSVQAFWTLFEGLVRSPAKLTEAVILSLADDIGANMVSLRHALRVRLHRPKVLARRNHARTHGVLREPTVRVQGQEISDFSPDVMEWIVEEAIEEARRIEAGAYGALPSDLHGAPMQMRLRRILVSYKGARYASKVIRRSREQARERALKVRARACLSGTDFVDLAIRFGDGAVELGLVDLSQLPPALVEAVLALAVGDISPPVEASDGFHIVQRIG